MRLSSPWVRAALATLCLAFHLVAIAAFARTRFDLPWNRAPESPPVLVTPASVWPSNWNRLPVSRWDSQHYLNLAARLYSQCPAETRRTGALPRPPSALCDLAFYPGYPLVGRIASLGGLIPLDYALLLVSAAASWIFFYLWTAAEIVEPLGKRATLVALACFNAFTTAFAVVTIQTEPLVLASSIGAYVLAKRGRLVLAALVAGIGTGVRVSGVAAGLAFTAWIVVETWRDRPVGIAGYVARAALCALSFWGLAVMVGYDGIVLHDPLIYMHAHEQSFGHSPSLVSLLLPDTRWLLQSLMSPLHEGVWVAGILVWLGLGLRPALEGFTPPARAYWYVLTAGVLAVSMIGSVSRGFVGMNRYALVVLPLFFAMGKVLERKKIALAAWLLLSLWHYWQVDLCFYVGDQGMQTMIKCHGWMCTEAK